MRICEIISDVTYAELLQLAKGLEQIKMNVQQQKKSNEQLTKHELHELMGVKRNRYYKSSGKIKQR
ncbi:MAG: hypothetical protein RR595_05705 [Lysinibacillus sp.]